MNIKEIKKTIREKAFQCDEKHIELSFTNDEFQAFDHLIDLQEQENQQLKNNIEELEKERNKFGTSIIILEEEKKELKNKVEGLEKNIQLFIDSKELLTSVDIKERLKQLLTT